MARNMYSDVLITRKDLKKPKAFQNCIKNIGVHIQEDQGTPSRITSKKSIPRNIIIKLPNIKPKEKYLGYSSVIEHSLSMYLTLSSILSTAKTNI
jgi:hypothetical protein